MSLNTTIKSMAELAAKRLDLPARFIAAWFVSENGWNEFSSDNNPGNISYTPGSGDPAIPSGGLFEGVTDVRDNRVCVYKSPQAGINAFCLLLEIPTSKKALSIDMADLHGAKGDVKKMCEIVGKSNWASGHYRDAAGWEGSLIWDVYNSPAMVTAFKNEPAAPPVKKEEPTKAPGHVAAARNHLIVQKGDTLSRIALNHRTTVRALKYLNDVKDPDFIEVGQKLELPHRIKVKPGDTVSYYAKRFHNSVEKIARMNAINPDYIQVGWELFV